MECFLEGNFSEDSNGFDNVETEAALYSLIHHSEDTYGTNMLEYSESYVNQRSKANRWEMFKQIAESVNPENYIFQPQVVNQTLHQIPIGNGIAGSSRAMYGTHFNKRGQYFKYGWNNHRSEKPWNVQDRLRNNYHRNRNLVPVCLEGKQIGQHFVDAQELLKINNFSSFESPRSNLNNGSLHSNESNKGVVKTVMYNEAASGQEFLSNKQFTNSQNTTMINRINPRNGLFTDLSSPFGASTSKNPNISDNAVECTTVRKETNDFLQRNSKKNQNVSNVCAVQKNGSKFIDISSENIVDEVVIISDTEDNDGSDHSIVEVSVPPKPSPPLIALDSSDEIDSLIVSKATLLLNISGNSDKSAIQPKSIQTTPLSSKKKKDPKAVLALSATSKGIKKKKKKHKRVKSVECKTWTTGMVHFYNRSWGGETYDHEKLQQEMTSNPSKWKILDADKYGPVRDYGPLARVRCANCHQFGHMAKKCPDPRKIICCAMCGERGHNENQCPNKLCLKCGKSAPLFNEGCPSCWNKDHPKKCAACGADDHFKWLCPNDWRKLHSITTPEEFQTGIVQETIYKSATELNCCFCAGKGHVATKCPCKTKQNVAQTCSSRNSSVNVFSTTKILNKKRKKKRSSFFEGNNNQHEFNRKRRKTN